MIPVKKRLGEMLLEAGIIDQAGLTSALAHQRQWGVRLGQALVELRIATEKDIVAALSKKLAIGVAPLDKLAGREFEAAQELVARDFATKNNLMPVSDDGTILTVAMSDPGNLAAIDELAFRTGRKLKILLGGDRDIASTIRRAYGVTNPRVDAIALDEDDDAATAIMPLVGHEHSPEDEERWQAPPSRNPRAPAVRPEEDERSARKTLLGAVPPAGFDVEKTTELEFQPELLSEDILEPEALEPELDDPFLPGKPVLPAPPVESERSTVRMTAPIPAAPLPVAPRLAPPRPSPTAPTATYPAARPAEPVPAAEPPEPDLPSRAAAAIAAVASRGGTDPVLADAARVLAAVLRVLLRKKVLDDREIAEELRSGSSGPREPR